MKTIGMLGGMSWESTATYYKLLNEGVRERLGGLHSAKVLLHSVDFDPIEKLQEAGEWEEAGRTLSDAARGLESGGADFLVLCTNTMHRVAPQIEEAVSIPLLHIADATGEEVRAAGMGRVGLLGTRFTMEGEFYRGRLEERHGIEVVVPPEEERERVHRVIYDELCLGEVRQESRLEFLGTVRGLADEGCEAVVLGCTEIGLLLHPGLSALPLFDTTEIHARWAVELALQDDHRES